MVTEDFDYVSEPRQVAYLSGVRAKLYGSIQRSRDRLTVCHTRVMSLADQYAFADADHFDPEEVMKVPKILHVERCRKLKLHGVNFT